jgi:hypothetical protein
MIYLKEEYSTDYCAVNPDHIVKISPNYDRCFIKLSNGDTMVVVMDIATIVGMIKAEK